MLLLLFDYLLLPIVSYFERYLTAFPDDYLRHLRGKILACPYLAVNNLNRDFIGTKGFSVVFQRSALSQVTQHFPFFQLYLDRVLDASCNAFYLNPLVLQAGSRVDPHIDRSLRSYCKTIEPPAKVSVLYLEVPTALQGGDLILRNARQQVGQIKPRVNLLLQFQGDLTHSVSEVKTPGRRLSLVCEQYDLDHSDLAEIPAFKIESRAKVLTPSGSQR